jgi:hypothetical protein
MPAPVFSLSALMAAGVMAFPIVGCFSLSISKYQITPRMKDE